MKDLNLVLSYPYVEYVLYFTGTGERERPKLPAHMRCAAHTLNLVATADADKALKHAQFEKRYTSAMSKCRTLWNKQNQSVQVSEVITRSFGKKFVTPNQTRWNSVYDSVECLLGMIEAYGDLKEFNKVITEHPIKLQKFTHNDVDFLKLYQNVMEPVAEGLDKLQAEKEAYMGCFLPIICLITDDLQTKAEDENFTQVWPLCKALLSGMKKRFEQVKLNLDYQLASAFHPKFRVEWMNKFLSEDIASNVVRKMKSLVLEELKKVNKKAQEEIETEETKKTSPEDKGKGWYSKLTKGSKNSGDNKDIHLKKKANTMVEAWIESSSETDHYHDSVFMCEPALTNLFIRYNTGIPSSAGVERMFSIGKLILRDNRSRLSDKSFEKLMFMKGNFEAIK